MLVAILVTGVLTAAATLAVYAYGLRYEGELEARTHAFAVLVFAELLRAFGGRSETKPVWRMGLLENARLSAVVAVSFALQIAGHHFEPLRALLQTAMLPWTECAALVGVALAPIVLLEITKVAGARLTSAFSAAV